MAAGAFSDEGVVEAAKAVVPILADCSERSANGELKTKYQVKGFPTVVFLDSEGKEVERLAGRAPDQVKAQIKRVAEAHTVKVFVDVPLAEAQAAAKKESKLLAILYTDDSSKSKPKNELLLGALLSDSMQDLMPRFIWVKCPLRDGKKVTEEAKAFGASKSPTLLLVDPAAEVLDKKAVLKKISKPNGIRKDLEKVLKRAAKK